MSDDAFQTGEISSCSARTGGVVTLFVSVDPGRDTPRVLKDYLEYFRVNSVGLTGTKEEIDRAVNFYGARYEIEKTDSVRRLSRQSFDRPLSDRSKARLRNASNTKAGRRDRGRRGAIDSLENEPAFSSAK